MASFVENFRETFDSRPFRRYDPIAQRRWDNADMQGLDNRSKFESSLTPEQRSAQIENRGREARRGTRFLEKDFSQNDSSSFNVDPSTKFFSNLQIAQNSDKLGKIIDKYESAKGWDERQQILEDGYNSFPRKTTELTQWFDNFATLTSRAANPEDAFNDDPEEIAGAMRYYLDSAKNKYFRKV